MRRLRPEALTGGGATQAMRALARRPLAQKPSADTDATALRSLAKALLPYLREVLVAETDAETLLDVAKAVPLSRRALFAACRRGELVSVKKGRTWVASRAAIDAWLREGAPHTTSPDDDDLEEVRRSLLRSGPQRRPR